MRWTAEGHRLSARISFSDRAMDYVLSTGIGGALEEAVGEVFTTEDYAEGALDKELSKLFEEDALEYGGMESEDLERRIYLEITRYNNYFFLKDTAGIEVIVAGEAPRGPNGEHILEIDSVDPHDDRKTRAHIRNKLEEIRDSRLRTLVGKHAAGKAESGIKGLLSYSKKMVMGDERDAEQRMAYAYASFLSGKYREALEVFEGLRRSLGEMAGCVLGEMVLQCKLELGIDASTEYEVTRTVCAQEYSIEGARYALAMYAGARGGDPKEGERRMFVASIRMLMIDCSGEDMLRAALNLVSYRILCRLGMEPKKQIFCLLEFSDRVYKEGLGKSAKSDSEAGSGERLLRAAIRALVISRRIWEETSAAGAATEVKAGILLRTVEIGTALGEVREEVEEVLRLKVRNWRETSDIIKRHCRGQGNIRMECCAIDPNLRITKSAPRAARGPGVSPLKYRGRSRVIYDGASGSREVSIKRRECVVASITPSPQGCMSAVHMLLGGGRFPMLARNNRFIWKGMLTENECVLEKIEYDVNGLQLFTRIGLKLVAEGPCVPALIRYEREVFRGGRGSVEVVAPPGWSLVPQKGLFLLGGDGAWKGYERARKQSRRVRLRGREGGMEGTIKHALRGRDAPRLEMRSRANGGVWIKADQSVQAIEALGRWKTERRGAAYILRRRGLRRILTESSAPEEMCNYRDAPDENIEGAAKVVYSLATGEPLPRNKGGLVAESDIRQALELEALEAKEEFYRGDLFVRGVRGLGNARARDILQSMPVHLGTDPVIKVHTKETCEYRRVKLERHVSGNSYSLYMDWAKELEEISRNCMFPESVEKIRKITDLLTLPRQRPAPRGRGGAGQPRRPRKRKWASGGLEIKARARRAGPRVYIRNFSHFRRFRVSLAASGRRHELLVGRSESVVFMMSDPGAIDEMHVQMSVL